MSSSRRLSSVPRPHRPSRLPRTIKTRPSRLRGKVPFQGSVARVLAGSRPLSEVPSYTCQTLGAQVSAKQTLNSAGCVRGHSPASFYCAKAFYVIIPPRRCAQPSPLSAGLIGGSGRRLRRQRVCSTHHAPPEQFPPQPNFLPQQGGRVGPEAAARLHQRKTGAFFFFFCTAKFRAHILMRSARLSFVDAVGSFPLTAEKTSKQTPEAARRSGELPI